MEKTNKKKFKNLSIITALVFSGTLVLSGCTSKIKTQTTKAINDINSGKYTEAKKEIDAILKKDSNNSEAHLLGNIISNFENAKKLYENKEYSKANNEISKIPNEYNNYNIKRDIKDLKNNIDKKLDEAKELDNKIKKLNKLINDEKLNEASKSLSKIKDKYITEEQKKTLNDLKDKLDKKIQEKKEKEKIEEQKKLELKKQNNSKAQSINKTYSNSKSGKITKSSQNQGNIHYVNTTLGIQMQLPASWRGKYYVREVNNTISFIYKTPRNKNVVGALLYIEKLNKNYNKDEIMMDDLFIKEINGAKYALGTSTDIGTNAYDLGEFEIYKEYRNLKSQKNLVYETVRAIK